MAQNSVCISASFVTYGICPVIDPHCPIHVSMNCMKSMKDISTIQLWGTATVGSKGQIVIPREAREELGICEGDRLVVMSAPHNKGAVIFKADVFEKTMMEMSRQFAGVVEKSKQKDKGVS